MFIFRPITVLTYLLSFLLLTACHLRTEDLSQPNAQVEDQDKAFPLVRTTSTPDFDLGKSPYQFSENISYDLHERNTFDLITPKSDTPTPLIVYIHGGGFTRGDKKAAYNKKVTEEIRTFVQNGIAFATINYRYLRHSDEGVIASLKDCQRFVQFVRYYADELNIDSQRIAVYGTSAGGGAGLWLGTHDDLADSRSVDPIARESSRVKAVVAINTQSTYDILKWESIFDRYNFDIGDPSFSTASLFDLFKIDAIEELRSPELIDYRTQVDMIGMMSADDATLYVKNSNPAKVPTKTQDLFHHPFHAKALRQAAEAANLPHLIADSQRTARQMISPAAFLLRELD
ncbi:MAG: alpha/beta hydrolase [Bacteroidota bacterium]